MIDEPGEDARRTLRVRLPHGAVIVLVLAATVWLVVITAPVHQALLLAGSLTALFYPVLFAPIDRLLSRWFGHCAAGQRRYASALLSTIVLGAGVVALLLLILWAILGGLETTIQAVIGLAFHDQAQIHALVDVVVERSSKLLHLYPDLHLESAQLRQALQSALEQTSVGPAFLSYLVTGTGSLIAQAAFTLLTVFYLFLDGPTLACLLLASLPLSTGQRDQLARRFTATATHLLLGTIGRAVAHGVAIGVLSTLIAGFGSNGVLVALVTTCIALLPVVGPTVAWLPLASILYTTGHPIEACCLGVASIISVWLIEHFAGRLASALGTADHWMSFLLFISVVGGVIGFGPRGLILGPGAVLAISLAASLLTLLYGQRDTGDHSPAGPPGADGSSAPP
jgi:predicted PurR-regulated permease PerM